VACKLIISLDFELMWGVRDHASADTYGDAVMGGRRAIPEILRQFSSYGVRATWATVGLLFARTRSEMLDFSPDIKPGYENAKLSSYPAIMTEVGQNEAEDPLHFGRSLIDRIADTNGQEIATHTFAHYYCLEPGQSLGAFDADLQSARAIAAAAGHQIKSIVFPRNQYSDAHIAACVANGITAYRGQPDAFAYRPVPKSSESALRRGLRLADSILPAVPRSRCKNISKPHDGIDVTASHFLRPWKKKPPLLSEMQLRRVLRAMRSAASTGQDFHLWWHPHNFGRNTAENLWNLEQILKEYRRLHYEYEMESLNMSDVALRIVQEPRV
jgi:peptidoglycan/xylan/chitin deacetylase (PgdA/CDA1 family)